MALLALADLAGQGDWARIILDTAPTGHTLRLLALPDTFQAVVELLDTMQAKHRFMVTAITHRYRADAADAFLADLRQKIARLRALTADATRTAVLLIARAEPVVVAETERYAAALGEMGLSVRAIVLNAVPDRRSAEATIAVDTVRRVAPDGDLFLVDPLGVMSPGAAGIARW